MANNKKKRQIPSTCALLFMLMIVCAILTWIVPAGEFDTEKVGNLNKVIAGTYHTVDASRSVRGQPSWQSYRDSTKPQN